MSRPLEPIVALIRAIQKEYQPGDPIEEVTRLRQRLLAEVADTSGVGKNTLARRLSRDFRPFIQSVSAFDGLLHQALTGQFGPMLAILNHYAQSEKQRKLFESLFIPEDKQEAPVAEPAEQDFPVPEPMSMPANGEHSPNDLSQADEGDEEDPAPDEHEDLQTAESARFDINPLSEKEFRKEQKDVDVESDQNGTRPIDLGSKSRQIEPRIVLHAENAEREKTKADPEPEEKAEPDAAPDSIIIEPQAFHENGHAASAFEMPKALLMNLSIIRDVDSPRAADYRFMSRAARRLSNTYRVLRDTETARKVMLFYEYQCQICGDVTVFPDGSRYAEVHFMQPLAEPHNGPDMAGNVLCLCPRHHVLLDYGALRLDKNFLHIHADHDLHEDCIAYHNRVIAMENAAFQE